MGHGRNIYTSKKQNATGTRDSRGAGPLLISSEAMHGRSFLSLGLHPAPNRASGLPRLSVAHASAGTWGVQVPFVDMSVSTLMFRHFAYQARA